MIRLTEFSKLINGRYFVAILGLSWIFPAANATVFTLDETGNYVVSQSVGSDQSSVPEAILPNDDSTNSSEAAAPAPTDLSVDLISETNSGETQQQAIGSDTVQADLVALSSTDLGFNALEPVQLRVVSPPKSQKNSEKMPVMVQAESDVDQPDFGVTRYDEIIRTEVAKYDSVDIPFVKSVIEAESNYNSSAVSPKGAMGLMQIMPETAKTYGVVNPFSAEQNIRAGTAELARLMDEYKNPTLALAAYNAGQAAVAKYNGVPPYRETQEYIVRVLTKTFEKRDKISKFATEQKEEAAKINKKFQPMNVQTFDW